MLLGRAGRYSISASASATVRFDGRAFQPRFSHSALTASPAAFNVAGTRSLVGQRYSTTTRAHSSADNGSGIGGADAWDILAGRSIYRANDTTFVTCGGSGRSIIFIASSISVAEADEGASQLSPADRVRRYGSGELPARDRMHRASGSWP